MGKTLKSLGAWIATGPNRIALSTALRGTIASAAPLALLPSLGQGAFAYPAVLGALATSMVDVGGPYRSRLVAMLTQGLGGACLLLLGTFAVGHWWLAALAMAAIGIVSGLARALGPGGASLGINTAVAFLVGLSIGAGGGATPDWVVGYAAGGLWTALVALAFWQFRPYRRLEQEVASAWEAVASLVAAVAARDAAATVVARRRQEQAIAASHAAARDVVERAREALGEMRVGTAGPGTTIAQLTVLLNAAARIGAAAVTMGELAAPTAAPRIAAESALQEACAAVARTLLAGKGEPPLAALRQRWQATQARTGSAPPVDLLAWAQAKRHLDNAEKALRLLFGERRRLLDLLRLALSHRGPRGTVLAKLRPHMTLRSAMLRHALRVALVTAAGTAIIVRFDFPHGIWLPLTSLVILQPDYGGTVRRAVERSGGTIAGAVLAGALLTALHGTVEYDVALGLLLFATFLLIRRRYGYAITFLTPLIILLIGMSSANPWLDLADRIAYTVVGALLAIAAGYLLWPSWEREQLRERLAGAVRADRDYLATVLAALGGEETPAPRLAERRRQAELAVANADAGFQRMLAEPTRRAPVAEGFSLLIYLHRLCRHTIALAAHLGAPAPAAPLATLKSLIETALGEVARSLDEGGAPPPRPDFDAPLALVSAALAGGGESKGGAAASSLLGRLVSDVTGLIAAAAARRARAAADAEISDR